MNAALGKLACLSHSTTPFKQLEQSELEQTQQRYDSSDFN